MVPKFSMVRLSIALTCLYTAKNCCFQEMSNDISVNLEKKYLIEAAGIRHNDLYSVNFLRIACSYGNIMVLGPPPGF